MEYAIAAIYIIVALVWAWAMMRSAAKPIPQQQRPPVYYIKNMMKRTGQSRGLIQTWIKTGRLKAVKVGRHYWCYEDDLMRCNVIHNRRHDDVVKMVVGIK